MAPLPATPRRSAGTRVRSRPKSAGAGSDKVTPGNITSEPPLKKRRYIPGGPGGGGRYVDEDGNEIPVGGTGPGGYNYIGPRGRIGRENLANGVVPPVYKRRDRDRSQRTPRTIQPRVPQPVMRYSSAAQAAASVSDSYKPREERAWEEFHPDLDIDAPLLALSANEVEGILESRPVTPAEPQSVDGSLNGLHTSNSTEESNTKSEGILTPAGSVNGELSFMHLPGTPGGGKRRPGRPPKNPTEFYARRAREAGKVLNIGTPLVPKILAPKILPPISNINAKEKLTLPQPSYRKTDTLARFEDKSLSFVRYVDKSMAKVGYQESDNYERPEYTLIKGADVNLEEDLDLGPGNRSEGDGITALGTTSVGRVEYDMDEQDDKWLESYNEERRVAGFEPITREIFEITITKIEKEWHALEKRIPKPNPKPPQTHRPRSSSAAAVNGEGQGEEQDSKCAICDDGDCENTNAIVFCDGCDLAVHQECYGVPFIPEGQWLCRKCQLIGRGIPTCIFCPNTDGAFKQTNSSKWAHLLCAMWIPEVNLGNTTFMEPVMEVEKVPKTRWKLNCYLCNQRMGACIQCGNKACYQAFHVTCARRARLFLKMKNSQGTLAVVDGSTVQKAFCDKHCPPDYTKENDVAHATKEAKKFYKRTMRGRLWADSQASASAMAATHRHAVTEHQPDESQLTGKFTSADGNKRGAQPQKPVWKLPSGAPVIPKSVFEIVEKSLHRFTIHKRKEYAANACQYWTLKREARRGAALLKRLQLQMETFSSMEITRRNFAGMGPSGRLKLNRRIEFAHILVDQLLLIKSLASDIVEREAMKLESARLEEDVVDTVYFPVAKLLPLIVEKALGRDKHVFTPALMVLQAKVKARYHVTATSFANDFCSLFQNVLNSEATSSTENGSSKDDKSASAKKAKAHAKRIIKAVQPLLEEAVRAEAEVSGRPVETELKDLGHLIEISMQMQPAPAPLGDTENSGIQDLDTDMADGIVMQSTEIDAGDVVMEDVDAPGEIDTQDEVIVPESIGLPGREGAISTDIQDGTQGKDEGKQAHGTKSAPTPPDTNGYVSAPEDAPSLQPSPPTPPISNGGTGNDRLDALTKGGALWYLAPFQPEGTSLIQPKDPATPFHDDLSDVEGALGPDIGEVTAAVNTSSPTKSRKGKAKKKPRGKK